MKLIKNLLFIIVLLTISTNLIFATEIHKADNLNSKAIMSNTYKKYSDNTENIKSYRDLEITSKHKIDLNSKEFLSKKVSKSGCVFQFNQELLNLLPGGLIISLPEGFCVEITEDVNYSYHIILEDGVKFVGNNYTLTSDFSEIAIFALDNTKIQDIIIEKASASVQLEDNSKLYNSILRENNNYGVILLDNSEVFNSLAINNLNGFILYDNSKLYDSNASLNSLYGFSQKDNSQIYNSKSFENEIGYILSNNSKIINSSSIENLIGYEFNDYSIGNNLIAINNQDIGYALVDNSILIDSFSKESEFGFLLFNNSLGKNLKAYENIYGIEMLDDSKLIDSKSYNNSDTGILLWGNNYAENITSKNNGNKGLVAIGIEDFYFPKVNNGFFCNNQFQDVDLENMILQGIVYISKKPTSYNFVNEAIFRHCNEINYNETIYNS